MPRKAAPIVHGLVCQTRAAQWRHGQGKTDMLLAAWPQDVRRNRLALVSGSMDRSRWTPRGYVRTGWAARAHAMGGGGAIGAASRAARSQPNGTGPSGHREERRWGYFGGCLESAPRKRFPWAPPNLAAASRCGSRTTQAGAASASMGAALIAGSGADSLLFGLATSVVLRFVQSAYKNTMAVQSVKEDASSNPG
jgi:hypothetical protein